MATMQIWSYRGVERGLDLTGYEVEALDGSIGTVDEATAETGQNYIVVDTGPWIFGKRVLLPAGVVDRVDPAEEKVFVNRSREEIRNAPEYDLGLGATPLYRERVGSYYAGLGEPPLARRTASPQRTTSPQRTSRRRTSKQSTSTKRSTASRRRSTARQGGRGRANDEPTKEQLYEQAKRLGIEGRSKMNKTQLKRAVGRKRGRSGSTQSSRSVSSQRRARSSGGRGTANPVEVQAFLEGVSYPTRKGDLVRQAAREGASQKVRSTLQRLPEKRFADPTEVSEAVSKVR